MPTGILLLDKPLGLPSNTALQRVRHAYEAARAGHVGSLDPLASGMLPICLDEATKVATDLVAGRKCYRFSVALGARTDTGDAEGKVVEQCTVPTLDAGRIAATAASFMGEREQTPPMYSALKQGGQPLYRLARAGIEVPRAPRRIRIDRLDVLHGSSERLELEVLCSKGTYVRTLAQDLAVALGTCGHVVALRRLYVEPFHEHSMVPLERVLASSPHERAALLLPPDRALAHLASVELDAGQAARVRHGQAVQAQASHVAARCRLYDESGRFLGIGERSIDGLIRPRRLMSAAS